jgi:hypothetical protein
MCHATSLTVAHLLGHASTQILPTYVRPLEENTRALIEALNAARKKQRVVQHRSTETPTLLVFHETRVNSTWSQERDEICGSDHVFITVTDFEV